MTRARAQHTHACACAGLSVGVDVANTAQIIWRRPVEFIDFEASGRRSMTSMWQAHSKLVEVFDAGVQANDILQGELGKHVARGFERTPRHAPQAVLSSNAPRLSNDFSARGIASGSPLKDQRSCDCDLVCSQLLVHVLARCHLRVPAARRPPLRAYVVRG
jgi:hypothetical protein